MIFFHCGRKFIIHFFVAIERSDVRKMWLYGKEYSTSLSYGIGTLHFMREGTN
jgi:hypothetical protein